MNVIEYADRDMMMIELAQSLAGELNAALMTHDTVSIAVPGGTTPGPVFDSLSAVELDWERVTVLLTDERWVPETSPRSNTGLLRERLFTGKAARAGFFSFYTDDATPEAVLEQKSQDILPHLPLSILLLGMGTDMHTASLFPGADRLDDALDPKAPALMAMRAPGAPEPRITLTAPVLRGAMSIHLLITGHDKRRVLEEAAKMEDERLAPVSVILKNATVHWAE
ncbi:6-phosphogluconolactonase [Pseudoruegeria sp. SK021]|uniref:6-phosphogluconolactonase n=1 Tax=Pseudoruegeria sp. SK021 TaxID=1933035 RepID=UPI000A225671|nr:6-phosphogluconolactonase [Pseudoruegeria sp. SK021]OSP55435.1 6-phosphogluconolactonase [Pseudoruegeria sp. SK021]